MSTPRVALVLVVNGDGKLLMGKRGDSGLYVIPGGGVEPGEEPEQAAIRELGEEAGLDVEKVSPVRIYPATPERPELHLFSALVPQGVTPHGRRDPDQEVPTEDWEWVDAKGGLPAKVMRHLHVPGDKNILPGIYDLKKVQPPPTFPKLGVPDDRRETPIVDTPSEVKTKLFAINARAPAGQRQMPVTEQTKVDMRRPGAGYVSTVPGARVGYSLGNAMRARQDLGSGLANGVHSPELAPVATQQHENFHQVMNRVRERHGVAQAAYLARNLYYSIPEADRKVVDNFVDVRNQATRNPFGAQHYEEALAILHNYLNNPGERAGYHGHMRHKPLQARAIQDAMKRAHRSVRQNAAVADASWLDRGMFPLQDRERPFLKAEDEGEYDVISKAERGEHCAVCGATATARVRGVSGRARAACKAHVGKVLSQHGEGVAAVEHLRKAEPPRIKFKAAFRHPGTGQVVATGAFHDVGQLPSETAHEFDSGFVDEGGRFYDRREAARTLDPVWGHHRALDAANLEGDYRTAGDVYRGLGKAEVDPQKSEVRTLLGHPDPRERALALKLGSATPADAAHAALDPDPWVWRAALNHPVHGAHAKAALAASNRDREGNLLHAQHAELRADPSLSPEHLQAMHRAWRDDSGNDLNLQVRVHEMAQTAAHPRFPHEGMVKSERARGRLKSGSSQSIGDASMETPMAHVGHLAEAWHRSGPQREDDPAFHDLATNEEDYLSPKAIYSLPVSGHELPQKFMAKPYGERHTPLSGWAEATSQALYHAAGIGHLHQDSFVAPHGQGETAIPSTVIHMVRGKTYDRAPLDTIKKPGFKADLARIALMDHVTSQSDRHDGNILVREENGKPLAIDNAQAFGMAQYGFKKALRGRVSEDEAAKALPWWKSVSPDVRRALESRLALVKNPTHRKQISDMFRHRADWLDQRAAEPTPNWKADMQLETAHLGKSLAAIPSEEGRMNHRENVPFSPEKMETLHRELAAAPMPHASERREHFETALNGSEAVAKPLKVTDLPAHAVSNKGGLLGAVRKAFYDSPAGHRYLVKGTHDAHYFGLGAWGEATSQALYHAAGIGHLHQHSHVSEIHDPVGNSAHGTVIHVEPDAPTLDFAMEHSIGRANQLYSHPQNDQKLRQIAMMDAITDNYDRHGSNLLIRRDGSPLAIDNARVFEQDMDHKNPIENLAAEPLGMQSDAWQSTDGPNSETWRWYYSKKPDILRAVDKQLDLLPDRDFREKTRQRFLDRLKRVEEYRR